MHIWFMFICYTVSIAFDCHFLNSWNSALTVKLYIDYGYVLGKLPCIKVFNFNWIMKSKMYSVIIYRLQRIWQMVGLDSRKGSWNRQREWLQFPQYNLLIKGNMTASLSCLRIPLESQPMWCSLGMDSYWKHFSNRHFSFTPLNI